MMAWRLVACLLLSCSMMRAESKQIRQVQNSTGGSVTGGYETTSSGYPGSTEVPAADCSAVQSTHRLEYPRGESQYNNHQNCTWHISAEVGEQIRLHFEEFDLEGSFPSCPYDQVEIHDQARRPTTLCGGSRPQDYISTGNTLMIRFHSDYSVTGSGFKIVISYGTDFPTPNPTDSPVSYSTTVYSTHYPTETSSEHPAVNCIRVDLTEGTTGSLTSPGYPRNYQNGVDICWRLRAAADKLIELTFNHFDLEESDYCVFDVLMIANEGLCGCYSRLTYVSTSSSITIRFSTDNSVTGTGLSATYRVVDRNSPNTSTEPIRCTPTSVSPTGGPDYTTHSSSGNNSTVNCTLVDLTEGTTGSLTSPGYPLDYSNNVNVCWRLQAAADKRIELTFNHFDLEESDPCVFDELMITNVGQDDSLRRFCGCYSRLTYVSTSNSITIRFRTDGSVTGTGLSATYRAVDQNSPNTSTEPTRCTPTHVSPTGGPDYTTHSSTGNNSTGRSYT